jgi:hypothetical protein
VGPRYWTDFETTVLGARESDAANGAAGASDPDLEGASQKARSVAALATVLGVTRTTVSDWRSGRRRIPAAHRAALVAYLRTTVEAS